MNDLKSTWEKVWQKRSVTEVFVNEDDPFARAHIPFVRKELTKLKAGSLILEAGCGMGQWVFYAEELGHQAIGIDIASNTLKRVVKYTSSHRCRSNFVIGDIRQLPFKDSSFDYILNFGVIEHFALPDSLLQEYYRILKPRGNILITTPNIYCTHTITRPILILLGKWNLGNEDSYSPSELKSILERCNFKVKSFGNMPGGELFGTAPKFVPVIGDELYKILAKISLSMEKKSRVLGFWSYSIGEKI